MKRMGIFGAVVLAAGAIWAAAPTIAITRAQQRYPWNDKIDIDWSVTCDTKRCYGIKFLFVDGATTNTVLTDTVITSSDGVTPVTGRSTIDIPTQAQDFDQKLKTGGIEITAVLVNKGVSQPDPYVLDEGDGVTFVPDDYLVLDLTSGAITTNKNVQTADAFQDNVYKTTKMVFRKVPVGSFRMQAQVSSSSPNATGTVVRVTNEYYIAIYQCTQKQYQMVAGSVPGPQGTTGDTYPCGRVSWNMIAGTTSPQFLVTLNAKEKLAASEYQVALPNEAQWERASRAGSNQTYFFGPSENNTDTNRKHSDYAYCSGEMGVVGTKSPNAWGLYDVYGNVWEWCQDWYGSSLNYSQQPGGPSSGSDRVFRGGSCINSAGSGCSSSVRSYGSPSYAYYYSGFRLIMTLK